MVWTEISIPYYTIYHTTIANPAIIAVPIKWLNLFTSGYKYTTEKGTETTEVSKTKPGIF